MMSTGVCRWLFLLFSLSAWTTITDSKEMRVVCYYTNWSVYRPGAAKFNPQNINPYLCTHLVYAFGGFTKENTLKPFDKYQDIEKGGYAKFTGLKTYNKNLKTMLAIGGWNEGSSRFSPMVANPERRKELVKNSIKFLRQNHFDGLDLDWEYPSYRDGGKSRDRDNYAQLVKELREEFDRESEKTGRPRLLLTMAVPAGIEYVNKGYDVPKLTEYLDWMNILSYDYHSAFEPAVNHHAPLYSLEEDNEYNYDGELNIDFTIKHYLKLGADPSKLILGIPTYGRSYTLFNPDAYEIGAPADGPGDMGEATRENGYLAYYEICENIKSQEWEVEQPNPNAMGPYAFKDNQWVGYDDENIVRKKSEYVVENGLGGIMFWAIDNDDFRGNCHGKPYPLIEAAKEALLNAYGLTDNNLISKPPSKPIKPRNRTRPKTSNKVISDDEEDTKITKVVNSGGGRRRNRNKPKVKEEEVKEKPSGRRKIRRKESPKTTEPSTHSSLKIVTPSYTTPAPPSTPELDGAFKCEDEGFFPHPKDCKKYFWCLSGAGDSGIVAHQFTCPAGLYFNKAADSCDYTQNVLCNKKLSKPTTKATTEGTSFTTATTPLFSTSRVPPKITAATSRTTYRLSTTTEALDEEYEYEDDDEDVEDDEDKGGDKSDSEEDPKVIKELIDLIRKAGGIEELEKQLGPSKNDDSSSGTDSTTQPIISKSLYERVLNKAVKNTSPSRKNALTSVRNSRGPQNIGLTNTEEKTSTRGKKLQYTSISRSRSSTSQPEEDEEDEDAIEDDKLEKVKSPKPYKKPSQLEYVNIRRPRISTTAVPENDSGFNRNKILGEVPLEDDDEADDDEEDDDDEEYDEIHVDKVTRKTYTPQYVNIRRQKPSTTEETTSSKYTAIRRGSTESTPESNDDSDDSTSKYKSIRRSSTTASTKEEEASTSKYQNIRRSTTQATTEPTDGPTSRFKNFRRGSTTEKTSTEAEEVSSKYKTFRRGTTATTISPETENSNTSTNVQIVTTPLDAENDVTERYEPIRRDITTATAEDNSSKYPTEKSTSTTVSLLSETSSPTTPQNIELSPGSSLANESTSPSISSSQDTPSNATIDNAIVTTEPLSTAKKDSAYVDTENYTVTTKLNVDEASAISVTTTESSESDSEKKRPLLLEPRPFSISARGPSSSAKPNTESTTQASKVSQTHFKFRLRPKASESQKDVGSQQNDATTENSKVVSKYRSRGSSRFSLNNHNTNVEEKVENVEEKGKNSTVKSKKRLLTTERNTDDVRTFRPTEIADLSSLTAVDFVQIKEFNLGLSAHRRRLKPSTLTTTEYSEQHVEALPTALPLKRKLTDTPQFARRRVTPKTQTDKALEAAPSNKVRGIFRSTRQPSTTESTDRVEDSSPIVNITPRTRKVIRRYRPTTSKSLPSTENSLVRRRLPTKQSKNRPETETAKNEQQAPLQRLFNKKPNRLPVVLQENKLEEDTDDDDSSTEEGENIKLSESNIRENSDVNSYDSGIKQRRKLVKLVAPKSENLHEKTNVFEKRVRNEKSSKEIRNVTEKIDRARVTTTESNKDAAIKENTTHKTTDDEITEHVTDQQEIIKSTTQPNIIIRTRKIIRKIKPTAVSVPLNDTTSSPATGRKRKIIRRLRPATTTATETTNDDSQQNNRFNVKRPVTTPQTNADEKEAPRRVFRPTLTRSKSRFGTYTSNNEVIKNKIGNISTTTASSGENVEKDAKSVQEVQEKFTPKRLFRPKVADQKNKFIKYKSKSQRVEDTEGEELFEKNGPTRISLKSFVNPTNTVDVDEVETTTENEEILPKRIFRPTFEERVNGNSEKDEDDKTELTVTEMNKEVLGEPTTTMRSLYWAEIDEDNQTSTTVTSEDEESTETYENIRTKNFFGLIGASNSSDSLITFNSEFSTSEHTPKLAETTTEFDEEDTDDDDEDDDEYYDEDEDTETTTTELYSYTTTEQGNKETEKKEEVVQVTTINSSTTPETENETLKPVERSTTRNNFRRPQDRPSFIRPKFRLGESSPERQLFNRPRYSAFSRSTTARSSTQTGEEETGKGLQRLFLSNRYKYKSLDRGNGRTTETTIPQENKTAENYQNPDEYNKLLSGDLDEQKLVETTTNHVIENTVTTESNIFSSSTTENFASTSDYTSATNEYNEYTTTEFTPRSTDSSTSSAPNYNADFDITTSSLMEAEKEMPYSITTDSENISTESLDFTTVTEDQNFQEDNVENHATDASSFPSSTQDPIDSITESTESTSTTQSFDIASKIPTEENSTGSSSTAPSTDLNESSTETPTAYTPESTTVYYRRSTLRSIDSRPRYTPPKFRDFSLRSTTESSSRGFRPRNRFGSRNGFQKSTTEKTINEPTSAVPVSRFLYKYSTTERANIEKQNEDSDGSPNNDSLATENFIKDDVENYSLTTSTTEKITEEHGDKQEAVSKAVEDENDNDEDDEEYIDDDDDETGDNEEDAEENKPINSNIPKSQPSRFKFINKPTGFQNLDQDAATKQKNAPNRPYFRGKSTTARVANKPLNFSKSTESLNANENLSAIDTKAVKNRNKNLFSKKRKMNTPSLGPRLTPTESNLEESTSPSVSTYDFLTTSPPVTEAVTKPTLEQSETTEYLTTLRHIFAEIKDNNSLDNAETTTEALSGAIESTTKKVERLIEVNRIVQVKTKEAKLKNHVIAEQKTNEVVPVLDKIGEINRITVINVVDGNNITSRIVGDVNTLENEIKPVSSLSPVYSPTGTKTETTESSFVELPQVAKVEEIPASDVLGKINLTNITVTIDNIPDLLHTHQQDSLRQDRKFEINSQSNGNQLTSDSSGKAQIIEGMSHFNVFTARPIYSTEASTIALEGLFQTDTSQVIRNADVQNSLQNDELLETEHSRFVNVRVLQQDQDLDKGFKDSTKVIPIRVLKQDEEEVTMKARVIEITPKNTADVIKIAPIRVEMSRRIAENLPQTTAQALNVESSAPRVNIKYVTPNEPAT